MNKIIELLQQIDEMDRYKMEAFFGKVFGYGALYILMIGGFSCLIAWILA